MPTLMQLYAIVESTFFGILHGGRRIPRRLRCEPTCFPMSHPEFQPCTENGLVVGVCRHKSIAIVG